MNLLERLRGGELAGATRLDLRAGLTEFPREIFDLADTLEVLDLSDNALEDLPEDLDRLHRLRVLFCSNNAFTHLPAVIGRCASLEMVGFKANRIRSVPAASLPPRLRWLILTDNEVESLPSSLGRCSRMQKLMLAGNRLSALPESLQDCRGLELLRISANRFVEVPEWLASMPRLAWLAVAGNPASAAVEAEALATSALPSIDWASIDLEAQLGEGASGVIHRALWRNARGEESVVALKLFKGAVTSDGLPTSELAACILAGRHPSVVSPIGRITGHPKALEGLALQLVPAEFRNLAGPPSLASCTRDVYAADRAWSPAKLLRMARGIAAGVARLHARGILHGDLYAHNILFDVDGNCLLGDFGAASLLPRDKAMSEALQRIEVRAFGVLLQELLERLQVDVDQPDWRHPQSLDSVSRLCERCLAEDPATRPLFNEIEQALQAA
ncbi:Serine/threonine protein kinase [Burkholderiales bacterium 8X]|nr:Serine/threonine protein kinase [Burkholderiales bacterium 8X]